MASKPSSGQAERPTTLTILGGGNLSRAIVGGMLQSEAYKAGKVALSPTRFIACVTRQASSVIGFTVVEMVHLQPCITSLLLTHDKEAKHSIPGILNKAHVKLLIQ